jgi:HlyD family secretion protein
MVDFHIPVVDQKRRRRTTKIRWIAAGILAVSAAAIGYLFLPSGPSVSRDAIVLAAVQSGTIDVRVQAAGTLQPRDARLVTANVPGSVTAVLVQPGDIVKPDSILVELSNPHLQAALISAQSDLADAKATLAATQATLDDTRLTLQANLATQQAAAREADLQVQAEQGLEDQHVIAALDYRKAVMDAATAHQQVQLTRQRLIAFAQGETAQAAAQTARVQAFSAAWDEAQQNLAELHMRAGQSGVVQTVAVSAGQTVAAGGAVAQIASPADLKAVLAVDPSQAGEVAPGQAATIQLNDAAQTSMPGTVTRVSPAVETGSVAVDIRLTSSLPAGARPALGVLGTIAVTTIQATLSVTTPVGITANSKGTVYRLINGGSRAVLATVMFGAASADAIQVLSGLQAGDQIIVSDTGSFSGKPEVRIQ